MWCGAAKKLRKDYFHNQQHQQRGEQAPPHAEHSPLVLLFEITLHQFLKEEAVLLKLVYHSILPTILLKVS